MNREFKFRAWDIKNKFWRTSKDNVYLSEEGDAFVLVNGAASDYLSRVDVVIQQFTGLKDKNGKEIYEGDIIKLNHWKSQDLFDYSQPFVVEYYEGEVNFKQGCYNNFKGSLNGKLNIEVIGNIYENLELINGTT